MFYGDGGRIAKVKIKKDDYARAFKIATKKRESKWLNFQSSRSRLLPIKIVEK